MSPRLDSLPLFRRSVGSRDRREETAKRRGEKKDEEDEYKYRWGARERGKGREGKSGAEAGNVGRKGSLFDFQLGRNYPSCTFHIPELEQLDRYDPFSLFHRFLMWSWLHVKIYEEIPQERYLWMGTTRNLRKCVYRRSTKGLVRAKLPLACIEFRLNSLLN